MTQFIISIYWEWMNSLDKAHQHDVIMPDTMNIALTSESAPSDKLVMASCILDIVFGRHRGCHMSRIEDLVEAAALLGTGYCHQP